MADDMVERVALALYESGCISSDDVLNHLARAAIEAMREPTEAMVDAVYDHEPVLDCVSGHDLSSSDAKAIFTIMIDAAIQKDAANARS